MISDDSGSTVSDGNFEGQPRGVAAASSSSSSSSPPPPPRAKSFHILVRAWTGKTVPMEVKKADRVGSVKERLPYTPKDRQILRLNGRELDDERTLEDYGIREGSSLDQLCRRYVIGIKVRN